MLKKIFISFFIVINIMILSPINTSALDFNTLGFSVQDSAYLLKDDDGIMTVDDSGLDMSKYDQEQNCEGLLGNPNDDKSVAWLLQELLNVMKIVGPLLVVVLSSFDFAKVIISGDNEAMTKAGKKLGIRLILAIALFFIPVIVNALLDVFGIIGDPSCGLS